MELSTQKKKAVNIGYITMAADAIELQGVEVTAHAAKVAVQGDSLVYNAAAYRVPEDSTLEALVKQLPYHDLFFLNYPNSRSSENQHACMIGRVVTGINFC